MSDIQEPLPWGKSSATVLAEKLEADIPPIAEFDAPEGPRGGDGSL